MSDTKQDSLCQMSHLRVYKETYINNAKELAFKTECYHRDSILEEIKKLSDEERYDLICTYRRLTEGFVEIATRGGNGWHVYNEKPEFEGFYENFGKNDKWLDLISKILKMRGFVVTNDGCEIIITWS